MQGETVFLDRVDGNHGESAGINQIIVKEPTAEFAVEIAEESDRLLSLLRDDSIRELALLKMEGFSSKEATDKLQCGLRTDERRLSLIWQIWDERG